VSPDLSGVFAHCRLRYPQDARAHKANGGYLVLPFEELFRNVFSWDGLKRALKSECVTIEEAGERLGFITTKGLRPSPIPLSTKVVLIGNPSIYQMLYMLDMDFKERARAGSL